MTPNHVTQKLRACQPSIGSRLNLGYPSAAEAMATLGFDWLCVDMEHGEAARHHGVVPGIHGATPEHANRRLTEGWKLVGIANDLRLMAVAAKTARDQIRA